MYSLIRPDEQQRSPGGTVTFEGEPHGSGVSMFLVNNEPGEGPDLHRHPYSETWIVRSGNGADDRRRRRTSRPARATSSSSVRETPHKFKNIGPERLDIICIHASPRMIQESLED